MKYAIWVMLLLYKPFLSAQLGIKKNQLPGVTAIKGDYLYMDFTEISNIQYYEYLYWLATHGYSDSFKHNYPDTIVWETELRYGDPFLAVYFRHAAYMNYPVVGVTQKQAENFCLWRRDRILEGFRARNIPIDDILVRLPTRKEWEYAARGGLPTTAIYPWPGEEIRIKESDLGKYKTSSENYHLRRRSVGMIRANMLRAKGDLGGIVNDAGFITTPVYAYWPNGYGLYNISGNVAEWVSEPGISKGGSWRSEPYYCRIDVASLHDGDLKPKNDIGFRCVIEIVKLPSKTTNLVISARSIENDFSPSNHPIQGGITEVSNIQYRQFLKETGMFNFAPNDSLWLHADPYKWHLMYSEYNGFDEYPVVNITYEGAVAYCEWLTRKYNSMPDRKYKSKQVIFRLPTEEEWQKLAAGGRVGNSFPWGGPYARNSRGCLLANYHSKPEAYIAHDSTLRLGKRLLPYDTSAARRADGSEFTCEVRSYFPNDYGLYNCSGNVAEMVAQKGISLGGSWDSDEIWLRINHDQGRDTLTVGAIPENYSTPSPMLGFRVLMEIR